MLRRALLGGAVAAAAAPALAALPTTPADGSAGGQASTLRLSAAAYGRLDASTPSQDLEDVVQAHLRLIQTTARSTGEEQRTRLAAVGSEAASLAGWLAWDMGNHGSARARYGAAVNTARSAGDPLLTAYQVGSRSPRRMPATASKPSTWPAAPAVRWAGVPRSSPTRGCPVSRRSGMRP